MAVLVHDQKNFPFMEEVSLGVAPGIQTFYSFKMKQVLKSNTTFVITAHWPFSQIEKEYPSLKGYRLDNSMVKKKLL